MQSARLVAAVAELGSSLDHFAPVMKPLDPPHTIKGDPKATEMLRLWAAHRKLNVAINIGTYYEQGLDEAEAWGTIAADFAKHVARALHQRYDEPQSRTMEKFRRSFLAELDEWSSEIAGE